MEKISSDLITMKTWEGWNKALFTKTMWLKWPFVIITQEEHFHDKASLILCLRLILHGEKNPKTDNMEVFLYKDYVQYFWLSLSLLLDHGIWFCTLSQIPCIKSYNAKICIMYRKQYMNPGRRTQKIFLTTT